MAARGLVASSLALLLLAGCIGPEDATDAGTLVNTSSVDNFTAPDGRGNLAAFDETNRTEEGSGGVDHHHDLWGGKSRVVLLEAAAEMNPRSDSQNRAWTTFRPPQGKFVWEGTESVEFTISNPRRHACEPLFTESGRYYCTDWAGQPLAPAVPEPNEGPAGLKLRYKHASASDWIDVGELTWGAPLPIQVTQPIQTDMPHATSSLWEFQVVSPNPQDVTLVFDYKVELVRGPVDIPLWPGHPDFYAEKPAREVLNKPVVSGRPGYGGHGAAIVPPEAGPAKPDRLISYGTRTLHVWANISDYQAPNPATAPSTWYLYHINATGRANITNPFDFESYAIDNKALYWVLPVDDNGMDSPYADASRWSFELAGAYTPPAGPTFYDGLANYVVKYTLVVHASSEVLPPEEYHMYCLQADDYCPTETAPARR